MKSGVTVMPQLQGPLSFTDEAYTIIKKRIIDTTYAPETFLTEASLSEDLQMSRMPVRMAVKRLQNEGWLLNEFRKKIKVKGITRKDVLEIYQLRSLVEESAMKTIFDTGRTWEFSHRIEEKVVRVKASQNDTYEWELADTEMHIEIIRIYDNSRIEKIYRNNQEELIRIGIVARKTPVHVQNVIDNLYIMVKAVRTNDYDTAIGILRKDHLQEGLQLALAMVSE